MDSTTFAQQSEDFEEEQEKVGLNRIKRNALNKAQKAKRLFS
jgi:hypothetical protein